MFESMHPEDFASNMGALENVALESTVNPQRINSLRDQIEASRLYGKALAMELQAARSEDEKALLGHLYKESVRHAQALQVLLEIALGKEKGVEDQPPIRDPDELL
jgi:hypothetical protein